LWEAVKADEHLRQARVAAESSGLRIEEARHQVPQIGGTLVATIDRGHMFFPFAYAFGFC